MENEKKEIRKGPKTIGTIILATLIVVGLIAGSVWGIDAIKYVSTDDAAIDGRQVKLSSKLLGRISKISTNEGARVNENDLLVTLDVTDLQAQEKQATAALASARQNLALSKINRDKTKSDTDRVAKLYANAATTREAYDHAVNALEASEAQLSLAQAQVDTSAAQLGVINAQILNATIRTPISGTVNRITLHEGDLAQPGQTILDVNNLDDIWVTANLEETKIGRIKTGAKVKITVDAYPHRAFDGTVEMIRAGIVAPAFQIGEFTKTTQRIPVKIKLARTNEGFILLPGMSAEVKIRTTTALPTALGN